MTHEAAGPEQAPSRRGALAALSLAMLLASLGTSSANVGLPRLTQAFNASFQQVQWVVLAYLLASTTLLVSVGRLGDITGRRRLLLAGLVSFSVASLLCGVAPTLGLLIAARAAQGLGAAVMMALGLAFVAETVPAAQTGRAMGLLGTMSATGTALGPSLGGLLLQGPGWRAIFLANLPLGLLAFVLAYRYLPLDRQVPEEARVRLDKWGTLLLALTLAAYALSTTIGQRGSFGRVNVALLLVAGCGAGSFVLVEARAASPLLQLALFRTSRLSASLAMSALVATVMMTTLVVGPFYLAQGLGVDAVTLGAALSVGPLVAALTGVPAGRIADQLGGERTTHAGLVAMAAGSLALATIPASFGVPGYIVPIVVLTSGYALFQTANNTVVMTDVLAAQRGVVSGLLSLSRNLGLITGASVMGAVFSLVSTINDVGASQLEAVAKGARAAFALATLLIVVALAIAAASRGRAARRSLAVSGRPAWRRG